jgi:hypothetical protein
MADAWASKVTATLVPINIESWDDVKSFEEFCLLGYNAY